MAKEEATLLIKIKQVGSAALKGVKKSLEGIKKSSAVAAGALKLAAAAIGAIGAVAIKTVKDFGEFQGVQRSFKALAKSQGQDSKKMLANMKELSAGTISNAELMKQANNAMLLGLPIDRMDDMLKIARSSAQATGESMNKMFSDLTTGLGRGSKLVLDNLGITFKLNDAYKEYAKSIGKSADALTEAEKKQAFINKALEVGVSNTNKAGETNLTMRESLDRVTAGLANMSVFIGEAAAPAVQFFAEMIGDFFKDSDTAVNSSILQDFFMQTAKVVSVAKGIFVTFGQIVGTTLGALATTASHILEGEFSKAADTAKFGFEEIKRVAIENAEQTGAELNRIDDLYANARRQRAIDNEISKNEALKEIKATEQEELDAKEQEKIAADMLAAEREIQMVGKTEIEKHRLKLKFMADDLKNFKGHAKKKALLQKQYDLEEKKFDNAMTEFKKAEAAKRESNQRSTLSTIASLSNSNNQKLAAIGKAAAITQIAIETPVAISKALSAFPPPANFIAAGVVGVAMAAQAAQIAGVQLAEGGVVAATPGGVPAVIGEGGRSEAVVPLPDDFDPDSGIGLGGNTFVFQGPILGDDEQARAFAMKIDEQLLELRRTNSSEAFDEGVS